MHIAWIRCFLVCAGLLLPLSLQLSAQDRPVEWGTVSPDDLRMKAYSADSSADALVLADYGESSVNNDLGVDYERHLRVKLFSASAFDKWGTIVVSLWTGDNAQRLDMVEGITYTLGGTGEIVKTELSDDAIYKDRAEENITRYRFAMPALAPGCIVDLRYRIVHKSSFQMPSWTFQYDIPSLWSEYRILYPKQMLYALVIAKNEPLFIEQLQEAPHRYSGRTAAYLHSLGGLIMCNQYRLATRHLPALKEEPYITTMSDYTPMVKLQLAAFAVAGMGVETVMKSWDKLIEELLDDKDFGRRLEPDGTVRSLAERLTAQAASPLVRMTAIYDYVRSAVIWDGRSRIWGETELDDILTAKKGNSADINFLLMALLKGAGIETCPVILSARSHGKITDVYPLVQQFDEVIARVKIGEDFFYLDATDPLRPWELLPPRMLNVKGLLMKPGPPEWVTLSTARHAARRAQASVTLNSDGEVQGTLVSVDEEYSALQKRHDLKDKPPIEIARTLFDAAKTGLAIDSAWVTGTDSIAGPVHITAHVTASPYAQAGGDFLYVNPSVIDRLTSSPFTLRERTFPVDMSYTRTTTSLSVIHIPPGYEVKELPPPFASRIGPSDAVYTRLTEQQGDSITSLTRIVINKSVFPAKMYASLKEFYDNIVASNGALIVLKRKAAPPPEARKNAGTGVRKTGRKK